ncbi:MAG: phosphoglycolate phosphatase [Magnetococcales bacterium]|nr:phosphoglycolate phosphatase [Magnetococcales bacterium]
MTSASPPPSVLSLTPPPRPIQAVIFDLDGAMVDTAHDLWAALNHALEQRRAPLVALEEVRHLVGHGARMLIARGIGGVGATPPESGADPAFEASVGHFLDYYRANLAVGSRPFPGVIETLEALRERGVALGVATNKPQALTLPLLEQLGLMKYFSCVAGGDTLPFRKPNPGHLNFVMEHLGSTPDLTLMLGDSEVDAQAARAAGTSLALVTFGFTPVEELIPLQPDWLLDRFDQLLRIVRPGEASSSF